MVTGIIAIVVALLIIPYCVGLLPAAFIEREKLNIPTVYSMGFIFSLGLFELISVPIIMLQNFGFPLVVGVYLGTQCFAAVAGLVVFNFRFGRTHDKTEHSLIHTKKKKVVVSREITKDEYILWGIFILSVIFQMVMYVCMSSFDGDDAYYVVQSLLSDETDTLYHIRPYTGLTTSVDIRHGLAAVPIWIAYIARISGIHSTIVAHSVIGLLLIPITYCAYYNCGRVILEKDIKKLPIFMLFVSLLQIFGNVSIYTSSTFFLTRTWQGKSMLANFVITSEIWLMLAIFGKEREDDDKPTLGYWLTMFVLSITAAMCSTSSVFLVAALIGIYGVVMSIYKKDIQIALRLMITCVPLVAYGALFLLL